MRALKRGKWEYASRANGINAVVILAEHEGKVILVDQPRVPHRTAAASSCPPGWSATRIRTRPSRAPRSRSWRRRPASLPTGSSGSGSFTRRRGWSRKASRWSARTASGRSGDGGGDDSEDIDGPSRRRAKTFPNFIEQKRAEGFGVDVKLLIFMNF